MLKRRGLLGGLGAILAMPAIIRTPGLLMPMKALSFEPDMPPLEQMGWGIEFDLSPEEIRDLLLPGLRNIRAAYPFPHLVAKSRETAY